MQDRQACDQAEKTIDDLQSRHNRPWILLRIRLLVYFGTTDEKDSDEDSKEESTEKEKGEGKQKE